MTERCQKSKTGRHKYRGGTNCLYCGRGFMEMHAEFLQRPKWLVIQGEDHERLVSTGNVHLFPKITGLIDDRETAEWHIARRCWTCGACSREIPIGVPYFMLRYASDEEDIGQHTSVWCIKCAIDLGEIISVEKPPQPGQEPETGPEGQE